MKKYWLFLLFFLCVPLVLSYSNSTGYTHAYNFNESYVDEGNLTANLSEAGSGSDNVGIISDSYEGNGSVDFGGGQLYYLTNADVFSTGNTDRSQTMWVKIDSTNGGATTYITSTGTPGSCGVSPHNCWHVVYDQDGASSNVFFGSDTHGDNKLTNTSYPINNWYHLAVVYYSGSQQSVIYVDGVKVLNGTHAGTVSLGGSDMYVGCSIWNSCGATQQYYGQIDDFRTYNKSLTREEVVEIMASVNSSSGGSPPASSEKVTLNLFNNVTGSSLGTTYFSNVTGSLTFTYFNITLSGFCVSYTGNGTGTNCTASGSGANTFFNATRTETVTDNSIVNATTYQALILMSAAQRYTNNGISAFNITNNKTVNTTSSGTLYIRANVGNNLVEALVSGNYSQNNTCPVNTALTTNTTCTVGDIYDNQYTIGANFFGSGISDFSVTAVNATLGISNTTNTTVGFVRYLLLTGYEYNFTITSDQFATTSVLLPANASAHTYNFSFLLTNTFNMSFLDELTELPVGENVSLAVISDLSSQNYTISNTSQFNVSLLTPTDYILRYSSPNYRQRDYYITLTNGSFENIRLYMINKSDSDDLLITVEDTTAERVENSTVSLLRYFVSCNCYRVVQMSRTGSSGEALFWVEPINGYYKWSVSYLGVVKFLSGQPENFITDTKSFTINTGTDFYESWKARDGIAYNVTYTRSTGALSYIWSDPSGLTIEGCLRARFANGSRWQNIESCTTGASGNVILMLDNTTRYEYTAYVETNTTFSNHYLENGWLDNYAFGYDFGRLGAFLGGTVLIGLSLLFSFSAAAVLIINAIGVLFLTFMQLMPFTTTFAVALASLVAGLVLFVVRR